MHDNWVESLPASLPAQEVRTASKVSGGAIAQISGALQRIIPSFVSELNENPREAVGDAYAHVSHFVSNWFDGTQFHPEVRNGTKLARSDRNRRRNSSKDGLGSRSIGVNSAATKSLAPSVATVPEGSNGSVDATRMKDASTEDQATRPSYFGFLDVNNDGKIDIEDVIEGMKADVEGDDALEDHFREHLPIFVGLQAFLCFGLWLTFAIWKPSSSFLGSSGGLENIFSSQTTVVFHRDCESHQWEAWRWFTYQWTHGTFMHVLMNCLLLVLAGVPLEGFHGGLRLLAIFNVSVVGGALAHMITNVHSYSLIGCSAGCYGLLAMHFADLAMNWQQVRYRKVKLFVLISLIGLDILNVQLSMRNTENSGSGTTAYSAHVGGAISGFIAGIALCRDLKVRRCEQIARVVALITWFGLVAFCFWWMTLWAPRSIMDPIPWCWARQAYDPAIFRDSLWHCVRCADQACIERFSAARQITSVNYKSCDTTYGWWK